jgi:CTP synthase
MIVEIGGTVGDIESLPFLEAVRQLRLEHRRDTLFAHVTLVPFIKAAGEMKTKPTQHSVKELREIGIQPDILLCRSEEPLTSDLREKIALFCNLPTEAVIDATDVESIYQVPLVFHRGGLDSLVVRELGLEAGDPDLRAWSDFVERTLSRSGASRSAWSASTRTCATPTRASSSRSSTPARTIAPRSSCAGSKARRSRRTASATCCATSTAWVVPGGFGERGIEGKIEAVRYARERGIPFLGLCLGMQVATIEFARNVVGWREANSSEFNPAAPEKVIDLLPDQAQSHREGGHHAARRLQVRLREGAWRRVRTA